MKHRTLIVATLLLVCSTPARLTATPLQEGSDPQPGRLSGEYRIGPQDVLSIEVFGLDDLDRKVRVLRDGNISLPLLGSFRVADLTPQEAEAQIARMLEERELINEAQVSIFVEEFVSSSISFQGAVREPGVYPLIGQRTLLEMISEAGGLLRNETGREIIVLRRDTAGQQKRIDINIEKLSQGDPASNILLEPDDTLLVQEAQRQRVYATGAVRSPGVVEFLGSEGISVLQAGSAAGGPTERANQSKVHIVRRLADGSQKRINLDLKKIRKGKADDVLLIKNDTVVVGEWFF